MEIICWHSADKGRFRGNFVVIFDNLLALFYRITLETLTMTPTCENVETSEGVPLTVTGVAQCKVGILYSIFCVKFVSWRVNITFNC